MKRAILCFIILVWYFTTAGCVTTGTPYVTAPTPKEEGAYHKVRPGETLWRISKTYGVQIDAIISANRLPDKQKIYVGQLLFIPQEGERQRISVAKDSNFIWPIKGDILSSYENYKDGVKNKGIDIKVREGAPVVASRSGKVSFVDENMKGFGKTIIIDHDDEYSTVYAYNSQVLVSVGQDVRQGTVIAKAGRSGRAPSPRLHFEIRKRHKPQNPFYFLP